MEIFQSMSACVCVSCVCLPACLPVQMNRVSAINCLIRCKFTKLLILVFSFHLFSMFVYHVNIMNDDNFVYIRRENSFVRKIGKGDLVHHTI